MIPLLEHVGQLMQHSHELKRSILELTPAILKAELRVSAKEAKEALRRVQVARTRYGSLAAAIRRLPPT